MSLILAILPHSIGGRLTTKSIIDGFIQNGYEVDIFDELKTKVNFSSFTRGKEYEYITGYDFSPLKLKIDYNLKTPSILYFSDNVQSSAAEAYYKEYYSYLKRDDVYSFLWDRVMARAENMHYMPHFVNCDVYKNFKKPLYDVMFAGRLDTDLRLRTYIELNKKLKGIKFCWYAIKKHYDDAIRRLSCYERRIIEKTYKGFIDNEEDMANAINETKIVYNINAQGISSLNYRTFQTLACERLVISDKRDELDLFNNIIPVYHNIDELADLIKFYLENKEEYLKITKKSREIIELNHDSKKCVLKMLNIIQNN